MPNIYRQGELDAAHGCREEDNPYEEGTSSFNEWLEGFDGYYPIMRLPREEKEWH